jgi:hypothetical protein
VISILLLGAVGTGLAYIWYSNVINAWGATVASTVTYLTPIVGVLLGILVLNERIRWNQMLGGVIVVFSVLISQGRFTLRSSPLGRRRAHALRSLPYPKGHTERFADTPSMTSSTRNLPCHGPPTGSPEAMTAIPPPRPGSECF